MNKRNAIFCLTLLVVLSVGTAHGQQDREWSMDVRFLSSLPLGRPAVGEGSGWGGQALTTSESPLFARWGLHGTRSYGVSIRRQLGKVGQLAFGFEQTRRIWRVEADWMPEVASASMASGGDGVDHGFIFPADPLSD